MFTEAGTAPSDAELIASTRSGDIQAFGDLFDRHRDAANRLARQLVAASDVDDLVSDTFAKLLDILRTGGGPDVSFRAYLLSAMRRLHVDRLRAAGRVEVHDDLESFASPDPTTVDDPALSAFERGAAAKAFASLPERWQAVLWHTEVEREKPAEVAMLLGISANSVSALAYRAREGLRQAYLRMHLADTAGEQCRWTTEHVGAYVREGLSRREEARVAEHIDGCVKCAAIYLELSEVNARLPALLPGLLLGGAASGYLATAGVAAKGAVGLGVLANVGAAFTQARQTVQRSARLVAAGAVATALVAAGVLGYALTAGDSPNLDADTPIAEASESGADVDEPANPAADQPDTGSGDSELAEPPPRPVAPPAPEPGQAAGALEDPATTPPANVDGAAPSASEQAAPAPPVSDPGPAQPGGGGTPPNESDAPDPDPDLPPPPPPPPAPQPPPPPPPPSGADLSVSAQRSVDLAGRGIIAVDVELNGSLTGPDGPVIVQIETPGGIRVSPLVAIGWACNAVDLHTLVCQAPSIARLDALTLLETGTVPGGSRGVRIEVSSTVPDPDQSNNVVELPAR